MEGGGLRRRASYDIAEAWAGERGGNGAPLELRCKRKTKSPAGKGWAFLECQPAFERAGPLMNQEFQ
jgi:hypothetical protein